MSTAHQKIKEAIEQHADEIKDLSLKIHKNPELGFEEFKAIKWQHEFLKQQGFSVNTPFAGMETAYRAETGQGTPVFAFAAEYDALKGLGHACGHNLIAGTALGAGTALAEVMREDGIPGTLVVLGTPAEEGGGGKVLMVNNGGIEGIGAVLMAHPAGVTMGDHGSLAMESYSVTYYGQSSHAAAFPHRGRNALDAIRLLYNGVDAWRQQLPDHCRIHGIITKGGEAPNIIPDEASCFFFLRSRSNEVLENMIERFKKIAQGASLMADTEMKVDQEDLPYKAKKVNQVLNEAFLDEAERLGVNTIRPKRPAMGSSDFGDVSQVVPAAHVYFGITEDSEIVGHSPQFEKAAATDFALERMLKTAEILARVGYSYFTDSDFREKVHEDFNK
jgi:amidohydrolase